MNILVPMAGAGLRLAQAGYLLPKPLVEVGGKPIIKIAIDSWGLQGRYIFVVQKEHDQKYSFESMFCQMVDDFEIVKVDGLTQGAACTALLAEDFINNQEELVIAVADTYNRIPSQPWSLSPCDGVIFTMESQNSGYSYAKIGPDGFVAEVAEKIVISNCATSGIYHWTHGSDFVKYAKQMIQNNIRINNEFYLCPVYNQAISDGKKFVLKQIEHIEDLGTHENIQNYLKNKR